MSAAPMSRFRLRTTLGAAAVAAALATAAPASASIGSITAGLNVSSTNNGAPCGPQGYKWRVAGYLSMTQAEAQQLTNSYSGQKIKVRLWGEDPWYDDLLVEKDVPTHDMRASSRGLEFDISGYTSAMVVNEDPERPWGSDEIYAGVRYMKYDTTLRSVETNRVYGEFWHGACY